MERRGYKKPKRKYGRVMASLTGAILASSAVLAAQTPVADASPSPDSLMKSLPDAVTDAVFNSKGNMSETLKDNITEKIKDSVNETLKSKTGINFKDSVDETVRETIKDKIKDGVNDKLEGNVNDKLKERINKELDKKLVEKDDELASAISERHRPHKNSANKVMHSVATAYASGYEDNGKWNDKTHIGTKVRPGIIAVDPDVIPLGSKVYIEFEDGRGMYAVAEDTGGAIKGNRIDIVMSNRDKAKDFGIQDVKVHVLDKVIDV